MDTSVIESLQQEIAGMSLLYINEEAVQILKEIGEGTNYTHTILYTVGGIPLGMYCT